MTELHDFSLLDLFRMEVEAQTKLLSDRLVALEKLIKVGETAVSPEGLAILEALMGAVHSIKGAARIVQVEPAVVLAIALQEYFIVVQKGLIIIIPEHLELLFRSINWFEIMIQISNLEWEEWQQEYQEEIAKTANDIKIIYANLSESLTTTTNTESPQISTSKKPNPLNMETGLSVGKDPSLWQLFCQEVETQVTILNDQLLALEQVKGEKVTAPILEALMRAAHSLKGAARIVQLEPGVKIAHFLEEYFVSAQKGTVVTEPTHIDILLEGVDLILRLSQVQESQLEEWLNTYQQELYRKIDEIASLLGRRKSDHRSEAQPKPEPQAPLAVVAPPPPAFVTGDNLPGDSPKESTPSGDRFVRLSAETLNRLMGLAGESLIEANWLQPFADTLLHLKHQQGELVTVLEQLGGVKVNNSGEGEGLEQAKHQARLCQQVLNDRLNDLERFTRRFTHLSDRLYREAVSAQMRPFRELSREFPRLARDLARQLGKQVRLEINGDNTQVDRDILEKLKAPLTHIIRNAISHGLEPPEERLALGKSPEGRVQIEARHRGGMLSISVSDDGRGIDIENLRQTIVNRGLSPEAIASQLTETELLEFLFLPGFSTATEVSEISGRGVGLDAAKSMAQEVGGLLQTVTHRGKGTVFHFQLPLTLSVLRALLVEIAGEPYSLPLARLERIVFIAEKDLATVENRQYFTLDDQHISLIDAEQVLELRSNQIEKSVRSTWPVVVFGDGASHTTRGNRHQSYGLAVGKIIGEQNLVVRPLDPRLGKVRNVSAAALLEDGAPVLILDIEDLAHSIETLLATGQIHQIHTLAATNQEKIQKTILVVDDSITVRELERKLLENCGYKVDVAVNGIDAWNAVRTTSYNLIITDIDMPRMNGIELVHQIKKHSHLKSLPVIIVSYKDREQDRILGLEAGADYYLTKSSFHDDSLIKAVRDVIGNA